MLLLTDFERVLKTLVVGRPVEAAAVFNTHARTHTKEKKSWTHRSGSEQACLILI